MLKLEVGRAEASASSSVKME